MKKAGTQKYTLLNKSFVKKTKQNAFRNINDNFH